MARRRRPNREISGGRRAAYYAGMALIAAGVALFVSVFFTSMGERSTPDDPALGEPGWWVAVEERHESGMREMMFRSILGMGLVAGGGFLMRLGSRGPAGSGLVLDPAGARRDLEPWTRAGGGMLNDALEEVDALPGVGAADPTEVVKVRCAGCRTLNDEDGKFCKQCGKPL